ncbi:DUF1801 domain-containing protein [Aminobacter sp. DSM 101952]|uniref:DUF1801 domain-containing protein n=1 Tax=Aminobacter sp. DSM 101952 TaxID=2735891 RepID=UPI0017E9CEA0|nr:DUF1801 domain-containing protein [Aminobacter sp. DSM 101952]
MPCPAPKKSFPTRFLPTSWTAAIYFSGWKEHYSLYPVTERLVARLGAEVAPYVAGKGTLRFSLSEPIPAKLIERIALLRAEEEADARKAKAAASHKARG